MKLYYTNAPVIGGTQKDPELSLGGIVSVTMVPNDYVGNIFSQASQSAIQLKKREVKLIALKNVLSTTATNIQITIGIPSDAIADYKISFTTTSGDPMCDFEKIDNSSSLPYYATFTEINNEDIINVTPSSLAPNELMGIWLMRTFKPTVKKSCDDFLDDYITPPEEPKTEENITLDISWT